LPSALLKNWTRNNPEFHSVLLRELPSAILALSLFNLNHIIPLYNVFQKALKARTVPAPNVNLGFSEEIRCRALKEHSVFNYRWGMIGKAIV